MNIALCKCGIDMSEHAGVDPYDDDVVIPEGGHAFDAAGTKYRCEGTITVPYVGQFLCARPAYHIRHNVVCGPLTGEKLWE